LGMPASTLCVAYNGEYKLVDEVPYGRKSACGFPKQLNGAEESGLQPRQL